MKKLKYVKLFENEEPEKLIIKDGNGNSYTPTQEEVQEMYKHLSVFFHASQIEGIVEISPDDRMELKKLLRLPDDYR
jgi:hypothetical protein